jgi:hypothetical protein
MGQLQLEGSLAAAAAAATAAPGLRMRSRGEDEGPLCRLLRIFALLPVLSACLQFSLLCCSIHR